jgi:hypothetical protein
VESRRDQRRDRGRCPLYGPHHSRGAR